jgi:hypothetical protein
MVETALFKQKGTPFHNYSTFSCGLFGGFLRDRMSCREISGKTKKRNPGVN